MRFLPRNSGTTMGGRLNRRDFFKASIATGAAFSFHPTATANDFRTKHVIWIINGNGSRKKDWYENPDLFPNYARLVREGFVYEESLNETVANHNRAVRELLTGNPDTSASRMYPTPLHYIRRAYRDSATRYWFINSVSSYGQWCRSSNCLVPEQAEFDEDTRPIHLIAAAKQVSHEGLSFVEKQIVHQFLSDFSNVGQWKDALKSVPIPRDPFIGDAAGFAVIPHILKEFKPRLIIFHQVGHDTGHGDAEYARKQNG